MRCLLLKGLRCGCFYHHQWFLPIHEADLLGSADKYPWLAAESFSLFSPWLKNACYLLLLVKKMELGLYAWGFFF